VARLLFSQAFPKMPIFKGSGYKIGLQRLSTGNRNWLLDTIGVGQKTAMSAALIRLPRYAFESNLHKLIAILGFGDDRQFIQIDFQAVQYYIPCAILAIVAKIKWWESLGKKWEFINFQQNPASRYFQRMDFCAVLGWELEEKFSRHPDSDDFVPIARVPPIYQDVAPVATRLASCIDPCKGEAFRLLEYASSEAILNARQHAGGQGFVSGQYSPTKEIARMGVADCGIGIRNSFKFNLSPHYRDGMSELEALLLALRPEVSSTSHLRNMYGRSPNRGVGLSMMRELMSQTLGFMSLISGDSWWCQEGRKSPRAGVLPYGKRFAGTVCGVAFRRDQIDNWFDMLKQARIALGLQPPENMDRLFL
jgi:hypothetical protein